MRTEAEAERRARRVVRWTFEAIGGLLLALSWIWFGWRALVLVIAYSLAFSVAIDLKDKK